MLLGLTGGVATGKSTFDGFLRARHSFAHFDADACVHELLAENAAVIAEVIGLFGPTVRDASGGIDRAAVRRIVFRDPAARARLEKILHPRVRERWQALLSVCLATGEDMLCNIPLLFETSAEGFFDLTIVVAATTDRQRSRMAARGLDEATIEALLASQWPMEDKIRGASLVVWNDGSKEALQRQAEATLARIFS
ncbi:MAG: dephospho-CoA kinase [Chthoniobacterales bacterium]